jgi:hypothetical protein
MDERIESRAKSLQKDQESDVDAPLKQARQMIVESDERIADPNAGDTGDETVERRKVEDLVGEPEA